MRDLETATVYYPNVYLCRTSLQLCCGRHWASCAKAGAGDQSCVILVNVCHCWHDKQRTKLALSSAGFTTLQPVRAVRT